MNKHKNFQISVLREVNRYENTNTIDAEEFVLFLRDWLLNHILIEDKKLISEVKSTLEQICKE